MKLPDLSIRRPVFAVMLIGGLVVLGAVSIPRLGVALFPRIEFPLVTVTTTLPGASPESVERSVSQVLEESINTIEGIRALRSASRDGFSLIFVEFGLQYDVMEKAQQVRERVAAVRAELPADADPPVVDRIDPDAQPILAILVSGPYEIGALSELADKRLKPVLERIPGVGSIDLIGERRREIRIWLDPLRLSGHGLSVDDVLSAVQREHVELPGGRIETGRQEYTLKTRGKFSDPAALGSIAIAARDAGVIHLRDVATVEDGLAEQRSLSRLNERRGVALLVRRQTGENTVAVARAVKQAVEQLRGELPEGFELVVAMDSSEFIVSAIADVAIAIVWGALLASLVVFAFLRNWSSTLIVALAIPTSVVATFTFFYMFGFTLNTMTLMALSLSIGLLIDDAIVVLENVYRHSELGEEPAVAASKGTEEVGLAVIATTLANCAVFVPIAFLSGVVGQFFREFGLVAACAVSTSTLVALTLTPMLCSRFMRRDRTESAFYRSLENLYRGLEENYRRVLTWGLAHRLAVVGIAVGAVVVGVVLAGRVPMNFVTAEDRSEFQVWLKMPLGSTLDQTDLATARVEHELLATPGVQMVFTTLGSSDGGRINESMIYTQLVHKSQRPVSQQELMVSTRAMIRDLDLPLADFSAENIGIISSPGSRNSELMYSIRGPEIGRLQYFANSVIERMRAAGGYADVRMSYELGKPEIALDIERERAADLGVSALQIGQTVSAFFAGIKATTFETGGERYDVRVQVRPEYRDEIGELGLVRVRSASGALVPLDNLVRPRIGSGPVQIDREGRTRSITVYANLDGKSTGEADAEIEAFAKQIGIGGKYQFKAVGPSERLRETASAITFAFMLALVAIYMILAAQFNSFIHPITIMLTAPLSFVGAFAALLITGTSIDVMGQIAFLMLMGIVMKNGILLVDYTNTLRDRGMSLRDAVLTAGPIRMRPVLMTAFSTIFGLLPLVVAFGDGSEWRAPMGWVSIGGLIASTGLTLLVVPVAYTLVADAETWIVGALGMRKKPAESLADS